MAGDMRRRGVRVDADGVRTEQLSRVRPGTWLVAAGIGIACVLLLVASMRSTPPAASMPTSREESDAPPNRGRSPAPPAGPSLEGRRVAAGVPPPAPRVIAPPPVPPASSKSEQPAPADGATAFDNAKTDEPTGLALFPPMGTKPLKRGFIVPDDFELPPGYIRHHQVTDDGEDVPPILMFHPDYHPVDANGDPIALPEDRVVPRDMVPPGMPLQMLDVPEGQGASDAAP